MRGLEATHLVDFLEAAYTLDRSDEEWLTECLSTLQTACGGSYRYFGMFYDASNIEDLRLWNVCMLPGTGVDRGTWQLLHDLAKPGFVSATFRSLLHGSARRNGFGFLEPILAER